MVSFSSLSDISAVILASLAALLWIFFMALASAHGGQFGLGAHGQAGIVVISSAPHGVHLEASKAHGQASRGSGSSVVYARTAENRATIAKILIVDFI